MSARSEIAVVSLPQLDQNPVGFAGGSAGDSSKERRTENGKNSQEAR
jgi:hypothetical protein